MKPINSKLNLFIGLMSGTSMDGIDAALVHIPNEAESDSPFTLIKTYSHPMPLQLKEDLSSLCQPSYDAINRMGRCDVELGRLFADCCLQLLAESNYKPSDIKAIGSHGQTIRHMPFEKIPFTLQIGDPNTITANTNITTVADFRRRDMTHGGQAAPLTPAFHQFAFQQQGTHRWILNIGGIANITYLPADKHAAIIGFDTGPGNTLLDQWCLKHCNKPFDAQGDWAASGCIDNKLLTLMLSDPYFTLAYPKSTGREYFNLAWLNSHLKQIARSISAQDIQATLLELTVSSIASSIKDIDTYPTDIFVCGGGVHNIALMTRLQELRPQLNVQTTNALGLHPDWVEAVTFAWLAKQTLERKPGNVPSVTGAKKLSILGAIFPA